MDKENQETLAATMRLSDIRPGERARIVCIKGHGAFQKRMTEMGFISGVEVQYLLQAPLNDPIKYSIMGYEVSLRSKESEMVEVVPIGNAESDMAEKPDIREKAEVFRRSDSKEITRTLNIALVGNPNCGKTSLFNIASGAREHVGNYSGVTVDSKTGHFDYKGIRFNMVDLPGTYSLDSYSPEESYVRRHLIDNKPDVIINVVDAGNLERNLFLTTELIDMGVAMVISLNMYDELEKSGATLDYVSLGKMIGVPVVPTVARTGEGLEQLFDTLIRVADSSHSDIRHVHVPLGPEIESSIALLNAAIKKADASRLNLRTRYLSIKLLERDTEIEEWILSHPEGEKILQIRDREAERLARVYPNEDLSAVIAGQKYGFISGALKETLTHGTEESPITTRVIDAIVTNRLFGFPIFLLVMAAIFWLTFTLGQYPMDWIESGVDRFGGFVGDKMPDGPLKDLIVDGIIGGVGGVIVFLPNILILYFCISFMEDSGYMARAAFIMDKVMHKMGLHGKSFIPLVMGFGCNVPAIMSSRAIESRSSRLITILVNPFMSCSARLPVFLLFVAAFFPNHPTIVMFSLYVIGIIVAFITARLLRRFYFKSDETPFVMELPPYRLPTMKATTRHMWAKGEQYLKKMGTVILLASIVIWALNYFPMHNEDSSTPEYAATHDSNKIDPAHDSYLEMAGKAVNPVMEPCGFQWRATVAALAAVPAKEIVVSTLGVLYTGDEDMEESALSARIKAVDPATGSPDFTALSALSFLIFILLYCPCMATVVAVAREGGHWGYGVFSVIYNTLVAWLIAFAVFQIGSLMI